MNVCTAETVYGMFSENMRPVSTLTVSTLAIYIVPGTAPATHLSSSVEFSSIFDMVFAATEGVAVPSA